MAQYVRNRFDSGFGPGGGRGASGVTDVVKTFVLFLYRHLKEKNIYEIHSMYESSFNKIAEKYFKQTPWPSSQAIAPLVENDQVFGLLYNELCYRHIYARLQPTLEQQCESWDNYCALYHVILSGHVNMQLPNQWLWDMIDEFIYQFQSFQQYRSRLKTKGEEEIEKLKDCGQVWHALGVLNILQALIDKSGIVATLENERKGIEVFTENDGYDYTGSGSNVLKTLGYFSMIGQLRVHSLLSDYYGALRTMQPIDLSVNTLYTRVVSCHVTLMYYTAFCYLMQKRYVDSIKACNQILVYVNRTKQYHQQTAQYNLLLKKTEQMYGILAMAVALCPQTKLIDDSIHAQLREKSDEKIQKMIEGHIVIFDELFSFSCPKFITPAAPDLSSQLHDYNQDAYRRQLKLFLADVGSQAPLSQLRSYLRLYKTIEVPKLAAFMNIPETKLVEQLMALKQKNVGAGVSSLSQSCDVDFNVDGQMVSIIDNKIHRKWGDFLAGHANRLAGVVKEINSLPNYI